MGLQYLPDLNIQYFSLREEIQEIVIQFLMFIKNVSPGWIVFITAISVAFIVVGVVYRMREEMNNL